jgi:hypothetical protein
MPRKPKQPVKSEELLTMSALIEIVVSESTPDANRIQALNKLIDLKKKNTDFFEVIMDSELSYGSCPSCGHRNHWLIPESEMNIMGVVTSDIDERVPRYTSAESCPEFAESCSKKKVGI